MKSQRIPMSVEEYELLPWKRGWKYEYSGEAWITPREIVEVVTLEIRHQPFVTPYRIEHPRETLHSQIFNGLASAYRDGIEFCDCEPQSFEQAIYAMTAQFISLAQSRKHAWVITFPYDGGSRVLAGCYVKDLGERAVLESLFVRPEWQRAGLATALLHHLVNQLASQGKTSLESGYWLGNEASAAWHRAVGFRVLPDLNITRLDRLHVWHELERRERLSLGETEETKALKVELDRLEREIDRLEKIADEEGFAAVSPLLRQRGGED
ncbi:MAG TPA: GNAT family N-acetyltransferase [Meiothermus sp.]|jgi:GNAT superfamily N-acetyltransferase|nr:GNAT family N-acetyltransferase [Meiothermus sp.]